MLAFLACLMQMSNPNVWFVAHRHTLEELEQLVETAKQAVPHVDAAIAAAIDRKVNPVSLNLLVAAQLAPHHTTGQVLTCNLNIPTSPCVVGLPWTVWHLAHADVLPCIHQI